MAVNNSNAQKSFSFLIFTLLLFCLTQSGLFAQQHYLVLIKSERTTTPQTPDGIKIIRAQSMIKRNGVAVVTDMEGNQSIWQESLLLEALPLVIADPNEKYPQTQIDEALLTYKKFITKQPHLRTRISQELEAWEKLPPSRIAPPEPANTPPSSENILTEKVNQHPPSTGSIFEKNSSRYRSSAMTATRNAMDLDGTQNSIETIPAPVLTPALADITIEGLAIPSFHMILLFAFIAFLFFLILMMLGSVATFAIKERRLGFIQILSAFTVVLLSCTYFFYGTQIFNGVHSLTEIDLPKSSSSARTDISPIQHLIYTSNQPPHSPIPEHARIITVKASALNQYLKNHLKFKSSGDGGLLEVTRNAIAFSLTSREVTIYEQLTFLDHPFVVTYQLPFVEKENSIHFEGSSIKLGNAPLPPAGAAYLWKNFQSAFLSVLSDKKIAAAYGLNTIGKNQITVIAASSYVPEIEKTKELARIPGPHDEPSTTP